MAKAIIGMHKDILSDTVARMDKDNPGEGTGSCEQ
jgi:hypothetical protein